MTKADIAQTVTRILAKWEKEEKEENMKKVLALVPEVRKQECDHSCGGHYTGTIPCTGQFVCHMCGTTLEKK